MQDFPISRYYCMTLCQNSSIEQRRVTVAVAAAAAGLLPSPAVAERRRNCRHKQPPRPSLPNSASLASASMKTSQLDGSRRHRTVVGHGGGGGISDPDHQVKGESLLHVLQRIGIAFFNLLLGLCWRCQGQPADRPLLLTCTRGVAAGDQPSIFQWGKPLVVVGKPMNSCTKRLKIGRQYSDNGAYTTTTIAKRLRRRCSARASCTNI